jgi:glycosyltransferase involved in cell wall biosynthesis
MTIDVDLWSTGFRGDIVQRPLVQAMANEEELRRRIIYCSQTPAKLAMQSLQLPSCVTAGTRRVLDIPALLPSVLRARSELRRFYGDQNKQRIVHVTMASPWDQLYIDIAKRSGAKILLVVHDAQRHIGEESRAAVLLENRLIGLADHIAVLSRYAGEVINVRLQKRKNVHIISPGLVMNADPPGSAKQFPTGRELRFLFFGRIQAYKGLDILLDAWARYQANSAAPKATLSIVGSGNIEPYRAAIDAGSNIKLKHGWVSDEEMAEAFASHDVNVLPYLEGSSSATSLAGMWAGMPAIATRIGGFADQLFDRRNALLCDIDADSISKSMLELACDVELYNSLAQGAHQEAMTLSAPQVVKNWIALYENILRLS